MEGEDGIKLAHGRLRAGIRLISRFAAAGTRGGVTRPSLLNLTVRRATWTLWEIIHEHSRNTHATPPSTAQAWQRPQT
eukprot:555686-Prymnesium_polylepis.1